MNPGDRGWRRPRSYHHGNLKEVLLEAARKLIEEHGAFGFSLTEAARLAGVSPAAPYRHFRDRDALLAEVAKNGFERFAARLDMAWNNGVPTPLSAFDNLGRAYLAFARDEPASYTVMFETGVLPETGAEPLPAAERAFDVLQHAAAALCRGRGGRAAWLVLWRSRISRRPKHIFAAASISGTAEFFCCPFRCFSRRSHVTSRNFSSSFVRDARAASLRTAAPCCSVRVICSRARFFS